MHKGFTYSRAANPTVSALEAALGALEDTPPAVCFATGMAAISSLFLAILKAGDHVVVSDVVYGGTVRLFQQILTNFSVDVSFVDTSDPDAVAAAIRPSTKLVFIETPGESHAEADRTSRRSPRSRTMRKSSSRSTIRS